MINKAFKNFPSESFYNYGYLNVNLCKIQEHLGKQQT